MDKHTPKLSHRGLLFEFVKHFIAFLRRVSREFSRLLMFSENHWVVIDYKCCDSWDSRRKLSRKMKQNCRKQKRTGEYLFLNWEIQIANSEVNHSAIYK